MSNKLAQKTCAPCEGNTPPLSEKEAHEFLKELEGWNTSEGKLVKDFTFPDFAKALTFVNKVGEIAEKEGHHPDITLGYGKARIELTTHAIGGLSENDFILAAKIDER